ncbi:MAG: DUF6298 domain-containing protein [Nitrospirota bacterium]
MNPLLSIEKLTTPAGILICTALLLSGCINSHQQLPVNSGPTGHRALMPHPKNNRYFTDGSQRAIYMAGSHTWNNFQDVGKGSYKGAIGYIEYLNLLEKLHHNFIRLWVYEFPTKRYPQVAPLAFQRVGPELAQDGRLRYDLTRFDQAYFDRLRQRVSEAEMRGMYVSIMLFRGGTEFPDDWSYHPFHALNNVNGIDGDPSGTGQGKAMHTLEIPAITRIQQAYVEKVITTVNDLPNVLYEVGNEIPQHSMPWQYAMINHIKSFESKLGLRHPVGMTTRGFGGDYDDTRDLFASPADWISPSTNRDDYKNDPPVADGRKVIIIDTDHIWGVGGDSSWVWKTFTRGLNPIYMDTYTDHDEERGAKLSPWNIPPVPADFSARLALGYSRKYADRIGLAAMVPRPDLCSTKYCLVNLGKEYLVYLPAQSKGRQCVEVELSDMSTSFAVEWFDPKNEQTIRNEISSSGGKKTFVAPFDGEAVLYIRSSLLNES